MKKEEYIKFLQEETYKEIDKFYGDKFDYTPNHVTKLNIDNFDEWVQFTIDYWDHRIVSYERPREYHDGETQHLSSLMNKVGRNVGNTHNVTFGHTSETNAKLIEILGDENIAKTGFKKENLLVRLLVKAPGHGIAYHHDAGNQYFLKFAREGATLDDAKRRWFPVSPGHNGHVFWLGNKVLYKWDSGDVYDIPWGIPHSSMNFGYRMMYTVSITGELA
jgi:hypothetical protein